MSVVSKFATALRPPIREPVTNTRDIVSAWRSKALNDTLFLRAHHRVHRFDRHFHEEYATGIIEGGCQAFSYDRNRRLDMPRGSVALISPGIVHVGWPGSEQGWSYRMLYPSVAMIREAVQDIFGASEVIFHRPVVDDPALYAQLVALHTATELPTADPLEVETLYLSAVSPPPYPTPVGLTAPRHDFIRPHYAGLEISSKPVTTNRSNSPNSVTSLT